MKKGIVVCAQKPSRGANLKFPHREGFTRIDVTSGSANKIGSVKAVLLSPLYLGPIIDCDGDECNRFENLWQYRKVYPQLQHWDNEKGTPNNKWTIWRKNGYKLLKNNKGVRTPPDVAKLKKTWKNACKAKYNSDEEKAVCIKLANWTPSGLWWEGECLDYITARKRVYVPIYANLIRENEAFKAIKALVNKGENVMILDLDGPPLFLFPLGMEINMENCKTMINNPSYLFGHGYVVAALLADLDISELCEENIQHKKAKIIE